MYREAPPKKQRKEGGFFAKNALSHYNRYKNLCLSKTQIPMEASMPSVDHETQQIINTYQQLYNLIFGYGVFIVLSIVSFFIVLAIKPIIFSSSVNINPLAADTKVSSLVVSGDTYIAK